MNSDSERQPEGLDPHRDGDALEPLPGSDWGLDAEESPDFDATEDEAARLHREATGRLADAAKEEPVGFVRQMLQLVLIPALIVAGIMAVWVMAVALVGRAQSLDAILDTLEGTRGLRPKEQERARATMSLLGAIDTRNGPTEAERAMLVERLPTIARTHRGAEEGLARAVMGAMGILAEPATLPVFREFLESGQPVDRFAAVSGLHGWRGDMQEIRPLMPQLLEVLRRAPRPGDVTSREEQPIHSMRLLAISVIGAAADPQDAEVRDALHREMRDTTGPNREIAWNAGCALTVMGDERGIPVLLSLLDRDWLRTLDVDPRDPGRGRLDAAAQRKMINTAINVVVGYDSRAEGHVVRVRDPDVWRAIEQLAEDDPDADVRALARAALMTRESR